MMHGVRGCNGEEVHVREWYQRIKGKGWGEWECIGVGGVGGGMRGRRDVEREWEGEGMGRRKEWGRGKEWEEECICS